MAFCGTNFGALFSSHFFHVKFRGAVVITITLQVCLELLFGLLLYPCFALLCFASLLTFVRVKEKKLISVGRKLKLRNFWERYTNTRAPREILAPSSGPFGSSSSAKRRYRAHEARKHARARAGALTHAEIRPNNTRAHAQEDQMKCVCVIAMRCRTCSSSGVFIYTSVDAFSTILTYVWHM